MAKGKVEEALIKGLEEALSFEKGEKKLKSRKRELPASAPELSRSAIKKLRKEVFQATQEEFAQILNIEVSTLRSWEQGLRRPSKSCFRLMEIIRLRPEIVSELSKASG